MISSILDGIPGHVALSATALSSIGLLTAAAAVAVAAAMRFFSEKRRPGEVEKPMAPRLVLTESGRVDELESFSQYVGECEKVAFLTYASNHVSFRARDSSEEGGLR